MKISVRNLEPTKVKLTVTVEPEELNPYLDAARKEIAKQVNVPCFRKGHVPGKIIEPETDDTLIWSGSEEAWPFSEKPRPAPRGHVIQHMGWGGGRR